MHDAARFCTLLADDCTLSATIYECLDWVAVHLYVNVEHCDVAEEFWIMFHCVLVVLLDHVSPNFFLNHLLCLNIVWVRILQLC